MQCNVLHCLPEVAEPARTRERPASPSSPPELERLAATAGKYSMEIKPLLGG